LGNSIINVQESEAKIFESYSEAETALEKIREEQLFEYAEIIKYVKKVVFQC